MIKFEFTQAEVKEIVKDGDDIIAFRAKIYTNNDNILPIERAFSDVELAEISRGDVSVEELITETISARVGPLLAYLQGTVEGYVDDGQGNLSKAAPAPVEKPDPAVELGSAIIDAADLAAKTIRAKPEAEPVEAGKVSEASEKLD